MDAAVAFPMDTVFGELVELYLYNPQLQHMAKKHVCSLGDL